MLKTKNEFLKISNIIFIVLGSLSLTSILSMIIRGNNTENFSKEAFYIDLIMMIMYTLLSILILWLTNKKIDLYNEEYPKARKVFNIFVCFSSMSIILMLMTNILAYIFYKNFSLYSLLCILLGYIPVYIYAYIIVGKGKILNTNNSKKVNIINLIVILLLINYTSNIIILILQMIFSINDVVLVFREIILSLIFVLLIIISYKLTNKHE